MKNYENIISNGNTIKSEMLTKPLSVRPSVRPMSETENKSVVRPSVVGICSKPIIRTYSTLIDIACYLINCKIKAADIGYKKQLKNGDIRFVGGGSKITKTERKNILEYERILKTMVIDNDGYEEYVNGFDVIGHNVGNDLLHGTIAIVLEYADGNTYRSINNTDVRQAVNKYIDHELYRMKKAVKNVSLEDLTATRMLSEEESDNNYEYVTIEDLSPIFNIYKNYEQYYGAVIDRMGLTQIQETVLNLLLDGHGVRETARIMERDDKTVREHIAKIRIKFDLIKNDAFLEK